MKLIKAQIKNFRSIKYQEIIFEPRLRTLVGVNEAGKSNILSALALLGSERKVEPSDVREPLPEEQVDDDAYVRFVFRLDAEEKDEIQKSVIGKFFPSAMPIMAVRGKKYAPNKMIDLFAEGLFQISIKDNSRTNTRWRINNAVVEKGWLAKKADGSLPDFLTLNDGKKIRSEYLEFIHDSLIRESDKTLFEPATKERLESVWDVPLKALVKKKRPRCIYWSYSEANLLPAQIPVAAFRSDPSAFMPLKEMFALAGLMDPETAFLEYEKRPHGRRNLLERVALAATKHLKASWPECKNIQIHLSPNGEFIDASVKDRHNQYAFDKRSDGFKRFITFLLLVAAKFRNGTLENVLFLQDEPDLGLHPSGIKHLLASLIALSEKNYVVVATHSIFLVDKERVDRHLIVKKDEETTSLHEVEASNITDEEVIYNALGYSLYDNLKRMNIVFEGWRDKKLFMTSLAKRTDVANELKERISDSVGLCHAKGLKDIPRISTFLQLAGRIGMAVVDSDEPARQLQRSSQDGHVAWYRYDELLGVDRNLTAEDFVVSAKLKASLASVSKENGYTAELASVTFTGSDAVKVSEAFLKTRGLAGDELKRTVNEWKSAIFNDLKATEITSEYESILHAIKTKLEEIE